MTIYVGKLPRVKKDRVKFIEQIIKRYPQILNNTLFQWKIDDIPKVYMCQLKEIYDDIKEAADEHNSTNTSGRVECDSNEELNNDNIGETIFVRKTRLSAAKSNNFSLTSPKQPSKTTNVSNSTSPHFNSKSPTGNRNKKKTS